jgi:transcriptional regulator with XRE-family HTH domain
MVVAQTPNGVYGYPMATTNGIAVQALRQAKHMTASELARRSGVTRQHIGRIERGECQASQSTSERIAKALEVRVEAFWSPEPVGSVA